MTVERPVYRIFLSADVYRDKRAAAFAWANTTTGKRRSEEIPSASKIEAEYRGLLSILEGLPDGALAEVFSDSALLCGQFCEVSPVRGLRVLALCGRTWRVVRRRGLDVAVLCVPKSDNPAWKMLKRRRSW